MSPATSSAICTPSGYVVVNMILLPALMQVVVPPSWGLNMACMVHPPLPGSPEQTVHRPTNDRVQLQ